MPLFLITFLLDTIIEYFFLTQLMQVSDINHPLNVNKKYEHLAKVRLDQQVGTGFKKVHSFSLRLMLTTV